MPSMPLRLQLPLRLPRRAKGVDWADNNRTPSPTRQCQNAIPAAMKVWGNGIGEREIDIGAGANQGKATTEDLREINRQKIVDHTLTRRP